MQELLGKLELLIDYSHALLLQSRVDPTRVAKLGVNTVLLYRLIALCLISPCFVVAPV